MIAVGIDPSLTSSGVAVLVDGKPKHYGRFGREGHNGASWASRSNRIRQSRSMIYQAATIAGRPDVVILEEHPYAIGRQGNEFDRAGLWHLIFEAFAAREIPVVVVGNTKAKSWITGAGRADKARVIATIDEWYADQLAEPLTSWKLNQHPDDVADALGLATMGAFKLGDPIPFVEKERHRVALLGLGWPKEASGR